MEKALKKYYGFTEKEVKKFVKLKNKYFDKNNKWKRGAK